jgi:hypothetical protein
MVIGAIAQLHSSTNIPGGNVSGTWTLAGSPYNVMGEITIPVGSTLIIEPGVTVNFTGTYKFNVGGQLLAIGTAGSPILFTAVTKWRGLRILNGNTNGQDSTRLVYCNFTKGQASGSGVDTYGGAIYATASGDLLIRACTFYNNIADTRGGAIYLSNSAVRIEKSLFHHNTAVQNGGAIYNLGATVVMTKLTITTNTATSGGGIYQSTSGGININNSILWNDAPNEILVATGGTVTVTYSDVTGGYAGAGNMSDDPLFVNPTANNYSLTTCSPCVDAGDPASPYDPDGTTADMGYLYFHHLAGSILYGGTISGTLYASVSPYYVCDDLTIPLGGDLLIEPGVEIRFAAGARLTVSGRLLALGTSSNPILFTASDTTGYYSGAWPGWEGVRIVSSNTNGQDSTLMIHCQVRYVYAAGTPVYLSSSSDVRLESCLITCNIPNSYSVYMASSNALMNECEISHNDGYGIYLSNSSPVISACQLLDNSMYSVYSLSTSLPVITGCTFDVNASVPIRCYPNAVKGIHDNIYVGTQHDYIYIVGGTLSLDSQWENPGIAYRLSGSLSILGMDGPDNVTTLTLEPGTEIRFTSQSALTVGHATDPAQPGALVATGTAGQNIFFMPTSSSPGSWQGIIFNDYSDDTQCRLEYCTIEYGGYSIDCNISSVNASPQILSSIISYSSGVGVRDSTTYLGNPSANLVNCQITNNASNGMYCSQNSQVGVSGCTFGTNGTFPIRCWANAPRNFHNNTYNGYNYGGNIYVLGDTICLDSYWEAISLYYYIHGNLLIQGKDGPDQVTTLQLAPGTEIMIFGASILVGHASDPNLPGALVAVGTPDQLISFFPTIEMPMSEMWGGVVFQDYSDDSQCRLEYCHLEFGGATPYNNIHIVNASPRISHTSSIGCGEAGIYVQNSSSEITNCLFYGDFKGITLDNSPVSFRNNIVLNCTHAINNSSFFNAEIAHNCFYNYSSFSTNALPAGLGTIMMNNFNGFPCDGFYNIFCDPLLDWYTYHLTEASPCINAGNPSDPFDPDNTITDIGMYYYPIDGLPVLTRVQDVPNDQGKFVHVVWGKSPLDAPNSLVDITNYSVWRRDELTENLNLTLLESPDLITEKLNEESSVTYGYQDGSQVWTFITQVPAMGFEEYAVVAPTLYDSVASSINYTTFRVFAHTLHPLMYFGAVPDSGYSVDNLAPHVPENLTANLVINLVHLNWAGVPDEDFQYYAVYRSDNPSMFPDTPLATTIDTLLTDTNPLQGTSYYVVTAFDFNGNESEYSNVAQVNWSPGIVLDLKIFLEGPFIGAAMNTMLNNWGYLPLSQPYNISPWNYLGSEAVTSIPNANVVDWALLELRETTGGPATATSSTMVARKALFLLSTGALVDVDGANLPVIDITVTANLYAVIWHRNHLAVMSSAPLLPSGGVYTYDFTTGADKFYGGTLGCKQLGPGKWGMVSGDGDANKQVNNSDKNDVWRPQSGSSGYKPGDFSLDGQVNNVDKLDKWAPNSGKSSQVPN